MNSKCQKASLPEGPLNSVPLCLRIALAALVTVFAAKGQAPSIQWQQNFGGDKDDVCYVAKQTVDGGFIFGGASNSGVSGNKSAANLGGYDFWVVKTDASGNKLWDKTYGGPFDDFLYSLQETRDGGFILGGPTTGSDGSNHDYLAIKIDGIGNVVWSKTYAGNLDDVLNYVVETPDGYLLGGISNSSPPEPGRPSDRGSRNFGSYDYWVINVDTNGLKQSEKAFGAGGIDSLRVILPTPEGSYMLFGSSATGVSETKTNAGFGSADYWMVRLSDGRENTLGGNNVDLLNAAAAPIDGGFIVGGQSYSQANGAKTSENFGGYDYWVVRVDANGGSVWQKSFGGSGDDALYSIQRTSDFGYILGGYSESAISGNKTSPGFGKFDYWIIKIDIIGNKQWEASFGGSGIDTLKSLEVCRDGGYILGGSSTSPISGNKTVPTFGNPDSIAGQHDFWVIKLAAAAPQPRAK